MTTKQAEKLTQEFDELTKNVELAHKALRKLRAKVKKSGSCPHTRTWTKVISVGSLTSDPVTRKYYQQLTCYICEEALEEKKEYHDYYKDTNTWPAI